MTVADVKIVDAGSAMVNMLPSLFRKSTACLNMNGTWTFITYKKKTFFRSLSIAYQLVTYKDIYLSFHVSMRC